jgi:hypothetical protein
MGTMDLSAAPKSRTSSCSHGEASHLAASISDLAQGFGSRYGSRTHDYL